MDKEYTAGEAKAWLSGYDSGKAFAGREWVGLTDVEVSQMEKDCLWGGKDFNGNLGYWAVYRSIEAKLKEKNSTSERSIQTSDKKEAESARSWVNLTDAEIADVFGDYMDSMDEAPEEDDNWGYERLLEAKIKEKNA